MRMNNRIEVKMLFRAFAQQETTVAAVAQYMADHNLTPQDVLSAYDAWLTKMSPAAAAKPKTVASRRSRAGDKAQLAHVCPKCGGAIEMVQLCHISSPHWRTQLVCMTDDCDWHGLSPLPLDALLSAGPDGIQQHVTEG